MRKAFFLCGLVVALIVSCKKTTVAPVAELTTEDSVALSTLESDFIREHGLQVGENGLRAMLPYEDFLRWVSSDPRTLSYPFDSLLAVSNLNIQSSPDGRLRFYFWDSGSGGTLTDFACIRQLLTADGRVCVSGQPQGQSIVRRIDDLEADGKILYLVLQQCNESNLRGLVELTAYCVDGDTLAPQSVFEGKESLDVYIDWGEWYDRADGEAGVSWLIPFDKQSRSVYHSLTLQQVLSANKDKGEKTDNGDVADDEATTEDEVVNYGNYTFDSSYSVADRYDVYQFDGKQFVKKGQQAGFWLHPSLGDYKMLRETFVTQDHRVRIDELANGRFRYASWPADSTMASPPEVVLEDGIYNSGSDCYLFDHDGYMYIVSDLLAGQDDSDVLVVKKDGKTQLRQSRVEKD